MAHGVIHWEIGARDADRVKAFYAELFGWDITPAGPDYALVTPEDDGIGGGILEPLRGDLAEAQGPSPGGSSPLSRAGGPSDDGSRPHDEESHPWERKTRRSAPAG